VAAILCVTLSTRPNERETARRVGLEEPALQRGKERFRGNRGLPQVVGSPATLKASFTVIGMASRLAKR
jgi:hypothetical protein